MEKTYNYEFNGNEVTVIVPENPNGEWVWKTEFLTAFDKAEIDLVNLGYTRVYYKISDMYGCYKSVRLMHKFYLHVVEKFNLNKKCHLFGFSRGGLYAFNFALFYPEVVKSIYLDAPVLDLKTWPRKNIWPKEFGEMLNAYSLDEQTLLTFDDNPLDNLKEFFAHGIPMLLVAGDADDVVPLALNGGKVIEYCEKNNIVLEYYVKNGCKHHPHSLEEDTTPIINFVKRNS